MHKCPGLYYDYILDNFSGKKCSWELCNTEKCHDAIVTQFRFELRLTGKAADVKMRDGRN
jgi:hypothetical protein